MRHAPRSSQCCGRIPSKSCRSGWLGWLRGPSAAPSAPVTRTLTVVTVTRPYTPGWLLWCVIAAVILPLIYAALLHRRFAGSRTELKAAAADALDAAGTAGKQAAAAQRDTSAARGEISDLRRMAGTVHDRVEELSTALEGLHTDQIWLSGELRRVVATQSGIGDEDDLDLFDATPSAVRQSSGNPDDQRATGGPSS